ncbi:MAG: hypothetical protein Q9159_000462 [Coniocarpon cinnabarinum]
MPQISAASQQKIKTALDSSTKGTGVPGLVFTAVNKNGEIITQQASGHHGPELARKMDEDSVFWIASCTKMVTGIACMQLVEQGKLDLDSSKLLYDVLPEVQAADKVLVESGKWEPRKGNITMRMLLTHTAGFGYSFWESKIRDLGRPTGFEEFDGDFKDIAQSPPVNQPGSRWQYGTNIDWAGLYVERVTGMKLDDYFQKHIFEPLGVKDTTMFPNKHMREHLVAVAQRRPDGSVEEIDHPFRRAIYMADQPDQRKFIFNAGGHGLFSKPKEYCKIISTLLNDGTSPTTHKQILKPETIKEMTTNQIPQFPRFSYEPIHTSKPWLANSVPALAPQPGNPDQGWGLSFLITKEPSPTGRGANGIQWAGICNLFWWADREKGVGGMIAGQILPFGDMTVMGAWAQCETAVYEGLSG